MAIKLNYPLIFFTNLALLTSSASAATALFLGDEVVGAANPALDPAFTSWLGSAELVSSDVAAQSVGTGPHKAVWSRISDSPTDSASVDLVWAGTGGAASVIVPTTIVGWNNTSNTVGSRSGSALLSTSGQNSNRLQDGSARPGFASGNGSGSYLGTTGGATADGIRNAINFNFSNFFGGGLYSFGIFGGDLETGNNFSTAGSAAGTVGVRGFLLLTFSDTTTQRIDYTPTLSLAQHAIFSGNNHTNAGYGNETGRFIGLSSSEKMITNALFVVGDDDLVASGEGDGDSEQLSFIAPITFLEANGRPHIPKLVIPEISSTTMALLSVAFALTRRSRSGKTSSSRIDQE